MTEAIKLNQDSGVTNMFEDVSLKEELEDEIIREQNVQDSGMTNMFEDVCLKVEDEIITDQDVIEEHNGFDNSISTEEEKRKAEGLNKTTHGNCIEAKYYISKHKYTTWFKCVVCDFSSESLAGLKRHSTTKHKTKIFNGLKPFSCPRCFFTSISKISVRRHFQLHHTGAKNRYKCNNCNYSTNAKIQIKSHILKSHSQHKVFCNECKYSTYFKCSLNFHRKSHHAYKCRYCDYKTTRKEHLLRHKKTHTGKPYSCEYCSYSSVRRSGLDLHSKQHHGDLINDEIKVVSGEKIQPLLLKYLITERTS